VFISIIHNKYLGRILMRIKIMSDLHLEFSDGEFDLPITEDESNTVLVVAGDIGVAKRGSTYVPFLEEMCGRFRDVICIAGNHEFYHTSLLRAHHQIKRSIANDLGSIPENLHYNDQHVVVIDDVVFICATLWTDMDNCNPVCMNKAQSEMNDYKIIRNGPSAGSPYAWKLRPIHTVGVHNRDKFFIKEMLRQHQGKKCVVVTHHAPSYQSIAPAYVGANSGAYTSEFYHPYEDIDFMPLVHVHGHVHDSFDYELGATRIICNPRGYYPSDLNPNFDPNLAFYL
jgi:Icc-related predicted phosphoesterase